jgi:hypothetical protein
MSEHDHFEELAALSAGGFLADQEYKELREHTKVCTECGKIEDEFSELVRSGLPLTLSPLREFMQRVRTRPDDGTHARFLARARREGLVFSQEVEKPARHQAKRLRTVVTATAGVGATLLLASYGTWVYRASSQGSLQSKQQIDHLKRQNSELSTTLSQLNQSLAAQQREIQNLRTQLGTAARTAENLRHDGEQARGEAQGSSNRNVQLTDELANRDKQLAEARSEVERINQLHTDDEATLVAQQVRISELSDQLRIAGATLDLERQLTAAGKDIRELLTARQLHVIDVRDTDANGKPSKAFGRIFVTEGKSLTFYAFDLNEARAIDAKHRFELWGTQLAKGSPARSLGFLYTDDKAQRRWALKVNNPELVKEVESVFVTMEPARGTTTPSGQAMLYTYLGGHPNHP